MIHEIYFLNFYFFVFQPICVWWWLWNSLKLIFLLSHKTSESYLVHLNWYVQVFLMGKNCIIKWILLTIMFFVFKLNIYFFYVIIFLQIFFIVIFASYNFTVTIFYVLSYLVYLQLFYIFEFMLYFYPIFYFWKMWIFCIFEILNVIFFIIAVFMFCFFVCFF